MSIQYPKGEIVWVSHYDAGHKLKYITTSKPARDYYYLYELRDGKLVKLGKDKSPDTLEERYVKC